MLEERDSHGTISAAIALTNDEETRTFKRRSFFYFLCGSGVLTLAAAMITTSIANKKGRKHLASLGHAPRRLPINPALFAFKALCYSTMLTFGIFSISVFGLCKIFNINNMEDLQIKLRSLKKKNVSTSDKQIEFESFEDFIKYLIHLDQKPKKEI